MSKYIDVDELIRKINEHECYSYDPEVSRICELINDAPILDVEPVRHGRWIKHYECCDAFVCSECGTPSIVTQNYCCNCGAKMDEKERENE